MAELRVGAVSYHPRVVTIWERFRTYFADAGLPTDYVLYSNYESLVEAVLTGEVDVGWNTNTAYVTLDHRAGGATRILGMRDVDEDWATVLVMRKGETLDSPSALAGRRLALGSRDSGHAAILPLHYLGEQGLDAERECELIRFDTDLGKHGDTGRSELDAVGAVLAGEADVAAIGISTWDAMGREALMADALEVVWQTDGYCHCMFTALDTLPQDRCDPWVNKLLAMDWAIPEHRRILEMEGLKRWVRPQLDGYRDLFAAVEEQEVSARW